MSKTTKQTRDQLQKPERQKFANSYIPFCALYLLDGTQYTFLHKYLIDKIQEIRSPEEEDKMLTYSEMCDWVKRLIEIYESTEETENEI